MNNKILIWIWLGLAISQTLYSQNPIPVIQWQKTFGGTGSDGGYQLPFMDTMSTFYKPLAETKDGGYIIGGRTLSFDGDFADNPGNGLLVVAKIDSNQNMVWKNYFGNRGSLNVFGSVTQAIGGGYIMTGAVTAEEDDSVYSSKPHDVFVALMNEEGQVIWRKKYGGTSPDRGASITRNGNTGYMITAQTSSVNGDARSPSIGGKDIWMISIDPDGNILWEKKYGSPRWEFPIATKQTSDGGWIVAAQQKNDLTTFKVIEDILIMKISKQGNLEWQKAYGGGAHDMVFDIVQDVDGGYVFAGSSDSKDWDVVGNKGMTNGWVVKLDPAGTIKWQRCIGGTGGDYATSIALVPGPGYLVTGYATSNNGDIKDSKGGGDIFLARLEADGTLSWLKTYGGTGQEMPYQVIANPGKDIVILGQTTSFNLDIGNNKGSQDLWLLKVGAFNTVEGLIYYDENKNGIFDQGERPVDDVRITARNGAKTWSTLPFQGRYRLYLPDGNSTISALPGKNYYQVFPAQLQKSFTGFFNAETGNFALQPVEGNRDLSVTLSALTPARPGFDANLVLHYYNHGTEIQDVEFEVVQDPKLVFVSAQPMVSKISDGKLIWNMTGLKPSTGGQIVINCKVLAPPAAANGDTLKLRATAIPLNDDKNPLDNISSLRIVVTGSYDPNDKQENNGGIITPAQVESGEPLSYLIRFQNTGTDTAFTVVIRDTLSSKVIPASLRITGTSHPYRLEINNENQLEWYFRDIKLVDSNANEPMSHGYVAYTIKPVTSMQVGDTVTNSASIYFDYNLPVLTNTELTVVKNLLALPVKLGFFKAVKSGALVDLHWNVIHHSAFSHFEIEKSTNGTDFVIIGSTTFRASVTDYRYTDKDVKASINYYRLKMIDIDGRYEYSATLLVQSDISPLVTLKVYPNPAHGVAIIDLDGSIKGDLTIRIVDQLGRVLSVSRLGKQRASRFTVPIAVNRLSRGTYYILVKIDGNSWQKKLVVQ